MLSIEKALWKKGFSRVGGIDEAGRGCLAGPVVAAAVVIDRDFAESQEKTALAQITDSKKMSRSLRESVYVLMVNCPSIDIGVGLADETEILRLNILGATYLAMSRAFCGLANLPGHVLVDGKGHIDFPCPSSFIVGGDSKSLSVAAASVVAKVTRDDLMIRLDRSYPEYGFARHKGYASGYHMQALFELGPTDIHRSAFGPVREAAAIREAGLSDVCVKKH